jgi:hypothetical protein
MTDLNKKTAAQMTENVSAYSASTLAANDRIRLLSGHRCNATTGKWSIPKNANAKLTAAHLTTSAEKGKKRTPDFPAHYAATQAGLIAARDAKGFKPHAGFTMGEILSMDADEVKAHKLSLKGAKVKAFSDARKKALDNLADDMKNLRRALNTVQGVVKAQKPATTKSAGSPPAPAQDSEPVSGNATEADSILPPAIRDPRLTELLNKAAQMDIVEQAQLADIVYRAMKILAKAK